MSREKAVCRSQPVRIDVVEPNRFGQRPCEDIKAAGYQGCMGATRSHRPDEDKSAFRKRRPLTDFGQSLINGQPVKKPDTTT